jgi:hypothetical protein
MARFQVGDKIKLRKEEHPLHNFELGKVYTVTYTDGRGISVKEDATDWDWLASRFERAESQGNLGSCTPSATTPALEQDIDNRVKRQLAVDEYIRTLAAYETASKEFNTACSTMREVMERSKDVVVKSAGEYYVLSTYRDGNFDLNQIEML